MSPSQPPLFPMQILSLDYFSTPPSHGNHFILIAVCRFSGAEWKLGIVFNGGGGDEGKSEGRYMDLDYLLLIYHAPTPSIAYIDV